MCTEQITYLLDTRGLNARELAVLGAAVSGTRTGSSCRGITARIHQRPLSPNGLADNVLQGGHVAGDVTDDEDVAAIHSLNDAIATDPRMIVVLIPIGDGVSFVEKLGERR